MCSVLFCLFHCPQSCFRSYARRCWKVVDVYIQFLNCLNHLTDSSVCEFERKVVTHSGTRLCLVLCACTVSNCCIKCPSESMVLTSGLYSFYLNLPQAVSNKVGSRDWSAFPASGPVLAIKEYFMCDTHTAYGRTQPKADLELAIINVNIWRVPSLNRASSHCASSLRLPQLEIIHCTC